MEETRELCAGLQCPLCEERGNEFSDRKKKPKLKKKKMQRIPGTNSYLCMHCRRYFTNVNKNDLLEENSFKKVPNPHYFLCAYCLQPRKTKATMLRHFKQVHKDVTVDKSTLPLNEELVNPVNEKQQEEKNDNGNEQQKLMQVHVHYICPECGIEFEEREEWRLHVFSVHDFSIEKNFKPVKDTNYMACQQCQQYLYSTKKTDLQRHLFLHLPYRSYLKCVHCGILEDTQPHMLKHLRFKCASKPFGIPAELKLFPPPLDHGKVLQHLMQTRKRLESIEQQLQL